MKRFPHIAILGISLCAFGNLSAATVLADEFLTGGSPNYTSGVNLSGQNPTTTGSTTAWTGASTSQWRPNDANLAVTGVVNGGGSLRFSLGNTVTGSSAQSRAFVPAASGLSTLWFGGVFQASSANGLASGVETMAGFLSDALPGQGATSGTATGGTWTTANGGNLQGFAFGMRGGVLTVDYQTNVGLEPGLRTVTQVATSTSFTAGINYFLVARLSIDAAGDDTLDIWSLTSAPADSSLLGTPTFSVSANMVTNSGLLDTLAVWAGKNGSSGTNINSIDALRMGTSYGEVVGVPEPSTWALLVMGAVALFMWRKNRRVSVSGC